MDPYKILGVNSSSTKEQIRKSYLKLIIKNHPDKSNDQDAEKKTRDIYTAYKILIDDHTRNAYDNRTDNSKYEYYNKFKKYIDAEIPNFSVLFENYIDIFYGDREKFFDDMNNLKFDVMYKNIVNRMPNIFGNKDVSTKIDELDIDGNIYSSLKNRYLNRYEKISVNRITKDPIILHVPLRESYVIFSGEGESIDDKNGDIRIRIILESDNDFTVVGNDIYCNKLISLYEYLYGGAVNMEHIDGESISIIHNGFIDELPLLTVNNKGMPYLDENSNILRRGKLYVKLSIENIDSLKDKIMDLQNNISPRI